MSTFSVAPETSAWNGSLPYSRTPEGKRERNRRWSAVRKQRRAQARSAPAVLPADWTVEDWSEWLRCASAEDRQSLIDYGRALLSRCGAAPPVANAFVSFTPAEACRPALTPVVGIAKGAVMLGAWRPQQANAASSRSTRRAVETDPSLRGPALLTWRERLGLSRAQAARATGRSKGTLYKLETDDKASPDLRRDVAAWLRSVEAGTARPDTGVCVSCGDALPLNRTGGTVRYCGKACANWAYAAAKRESRARGRERERSSSYQQRVEAA